MKTITTMIKLNITILLKDPISFLWSILLPTIILILNGNFINSELDLIYWWVYIAVNSLIYGVGLYALNERDTVFLSTIFSIKWIPIEFFWGGLFTQYIYITICFSLFNLIASLLYNLNYLLLIYYSTVCLIYATPIAFLSYNLTFIKKINVATISAICNIVIFTLFITMTTDLAWNSYNPFSYIANTVYHFLYSNHFSVSYLLLSVLIIGVSIPSILNFRPLSTEIR